MAGWRDDSGGPVGAGVVAAVFSLSIIKKYQLAARSTVQDAMLRRQRRCFTGWTASPDDSQPHHVITPTHGKPEAAGRTKTSSL